MTEYERRTQVLEAEQAIRLLAKSLASADTSRREFDTQISVLTSAATAVGDANQSLAQMRDLIASEHEQAITALSVASTETRNALETATEHLSKLGAQAVTVAAEQASSAARRMRELEENVDRAMGQAESRLEKVDQAVAGFQKALAEQFSIAISSIGSDMTVSTNRVLEAVRWAEGSLGKSTTSAVSDSTQKVNKRIDEIDRSLRQHARTTADELRTVINDSVETLAGKLAKAHDQLRTEGEKQFKRTRVFLLWLCLAEAAVALGLGLLLWRHW